jgi:hypothetical protein
VTLVNIFGSLWRDSSAPREIVKELKDWLGRLYVEGDEKLRTCIVTATLEHLFSFKIPRHFGVLLAIGHYEIRPCGVN